MPNQLTIPQSVYSQIDLSELEQLGRIVGEEKSTYLVFDNNLKEITLKKNIHTELCVGDWVLLKKDQYGESFLDRRLSSEKVLTRSRDLETQKIVSNIDQMWIITSANSDFNLNRLERYYHLALNAQATPIIVITKVELITGEEVQALSQKILNRIPNAQICGISVLKNIGLEQLYSLLRPTETIALMGSSGVGKSTLINYLKGNKVQKTQDISSSDKGRHTTTNRKLFMLANGSYIVDNPGIRTVGVAGFKIESKCKFSDCSHTNEPGCKIIEKVNQGELDEDQYKNMLKLQRESDYFESKNDPVLRKERKQEWKSVTKGINQRRR